MPKKTKKTNVKKVKNIKPAMHWFKKWLLYCFVTFGFILCCYIGYLDYTVRKQFEGRRWSIPARVYATPVEIYNGYSLSIAQFEDLLQHGCIS